MLLLLEREKGGSEKGQKEGEEHGHCAFVLCRWCEGKASRK